MDVSRNKQLAGAGQVCPRAPWIPHICSFHQMMKMIGVIGDEDIWRRWSYQVCLVGKRVLLASALLASPLLLSRLATTHQH